MSNGKGKQSESLKGNQNARKSIHGSVVLRIPGAFVDAMHESMQKEGFTWDIEKADVLDYALTLMQRQLEVAGCPPKLRPVLLEHEDALEYLDGQRDPEREH
jgi:hypothetical protein